MLGKHGFGGYYDLLETLKMIAGDLNIGETGIDVSDPEYKWTLPELVKLIQRWAFALSCVDGHGHLYAEAAKLIKEGKR